MDNDVLKSFREILVALNVLHKQLKERRRQLVQVVGVGIEIEPISSRCGFTIKILGDARDLYAKLMRSDEELPSLDGVKLTTDFRGHDMSRSTEKENKNE